MKTGGKKMKNETYQKSQCSPRLTGQPRPTSPTPDILPGTILIHRDGWRAMFFAYNGISHKYIIVRQELPGYKGEQTNQFSKHPIPYPAAEFNIMKGGR